jgi:hypothetical protein
LYTKNNEDAKAFEIVKKARKAPKFEWAQVSLFKNIDAMKFKSHNVHECGSSKYKIDSKIKH